MSKILMTVNSPSVYGASRMAASFALAAHLDGHEMHMAYCQRLPKGAPSIAQVLSESGIAVHYVPDMSKELMPFVDKPLTRLVRNEKFDLVISAQQRDQALSMAAADRNQVGAIAICMNQPRFRGNAVVRAAKKYFFSRGLRQHADRIIVVAPDIKSFLVKEMSVAPEKIEVVPCGLDPESIPQRDEDAIGKLRSELGLEDDGFTVVNLARIDQQKAQDVLIHAVGKLKAANQLPDKFRLFFVGGCENPAAEALLKQHQALKTRLGLDGIIEFVGFRKDFRNFLYVADLFALSSRWEGLPLVLLEAFEAAVPVLTTEYGERLEGFQQGRDGLYVSNDDPDAMAKGLTHFIEMSSQDRKGIGCHGRTFLHENLTLEKSLRKFLRILNESL